MIKLSYSTLNLIYTHPHNYLNKIMGIEQPKIFFLEQGKKLHKIIQDHVSGVKKNEKLSHLKLSFPIVETKEFDPNCAIEFKINDKYCMIGYYDGIDHENKRTLEIKTSNKMWSIGQFEKSIQSRIYSIALPHIKENVLITATNDDSLWKVYKPKEYIIPVKKEDKKIAMDWILEGIYRLEHIKEYVDKELEPTGGKCVDRFCFWGNNCQYKQ